MNTAEQNSTQTIQSESTGEKAAGNSRPETKLIAIPFLNSGCMSSNQSELFKLKILGHFGSIKGNHLWFNSYRSN